MIKKIIKLLLAYCRVYRKPIYFNNKIVCCNRILGRLSEVDFDRKFYLECYDDIRRSGTDPVQHFYYHGKSEGRLGLPLVPKIDLNKIDEARDTVLLVTHELSKTGAPILAYNIVKELSKKYNVVVVSLGGGALYDEFEKLDVLFFCEPSLRNSEQVSEVFFKKLHEEINFRFAIVNSIESGSVLPGLYRLDTPTISLVHEFPSYSGGLDRFRRCIYWSARVLLSSETLKSELLKTGQLSDSDKLAVLPQGKCVVPISKIENCAAHPVVKSHDIMRIIGAGTITYRKGVDLFVECARAIREGKGGYDLEFIWIGKNVDGVLGTDYSQYLEDQVNRSGLQSCFHFADETDDYEEILSGADVFLMTSRLDPLPNVAIDAFAKNVPVFFFKDATGLSSLISKTYLENVLCADYLSPSSMATKVMLYMHSVEKPRILEEISKFYGANFLFDEYIKKLDMYSLDAVDRHAELVRDADFLRSNSEINECFCDPKIWNLLGPEDKSRRYINTWKSNIYKYRPAPDFHPSIYRDLSNSVGDPYVSYIKSGRPAGPWKSDLIYVEHSIFDTISELSVAVHIHCYYPDLLVDVLSRLALNKSKVDIYVSTNSTEKKDIIASMFCGFSLAPKSIDVIPNIGRDIGPFLNIYCSKLSDRYDVTFHVHTKKSPHVDGQDGRNWYEYCLENLLGGIGGNVLDKILFEFCDKSLGLVYPSDPNAIGWGENYQYSECVLGRLGLTAKNGDFNFPIGTMFAASKLLVRRLCDLNFNWDDYPREPLPIDGTMLHAIERSIPCISEDLGLRQMQVYVNGTTRL